MEDINKYKCRVKATGEIVFGEVGSEMFYVKEGRGYRTFLFDQLDYMDDKPTPVVFWPTKPIEKPQLFFFDWTTFHHQVAKDVLCARISTNGNILNRDTNTGEILDKNGLQLQVGEAISYADELVKQLQNHEVPGSDY